MLKVGLTGGIGSGKTTVARIFEVLGVPVYYADLEAKRLMHEDPELREAISSAFGKNIYTDGKLEKKALASIVFADSEKLLLLNSLVHPVTIQDGESWAGRQKTPYVLREAALIFESGVDKFLDGTIGVSAPADLRINRVMQRDNVTRDAVISRMQHQMNDALKLDKCDYLIFNDDQQLLIPQVIQLHEKLVELAART